jgi:hypothetical protein
MSPLRRLPRSQEGDRPMLSGPSGSGAERVFLGEVFMR